MNVAQIRQNAQEAAAARHARIVIAWPLIAATIREHGHTPPALPDNPTGAANKIRAIHRATGHRLEVPSAILAADLCLDTDAAPYEPSRPAAACPYLPGTRERVLCYADRVANGQALWNPADATGEADDSHPMAAIRRTGTRRNNQYLTDA